MRDSTPGIGRRLVVRLDSVAAPTRVGPQQYYGEGFDGFPRLPGQASLIRWLSHATDSLEIVSIGLGGTGWRLGTAGDSLTGQAYEYYDIVPNETPAGPASAHRRACL